MMRCRSLLLSLLLTFGLSAGVAADELFMVRSSHAFPETMSTLQEVITRHGYTVSRVQRVDIGLTDSGFKTDMYRLVFFAKPAELRDLSQRYPHLIPYLPWPITIFAEGEETLLVTANPAELHALAHNDELKQLFQRWSVEYRAILEEVRKGE
ncbi:MAG: DUF302 domain-containing protein [Pseudomonadota bacterium]